MSEQPRRPQFLLHETKTPDSKLADMFEGLITVLDGVDTSRIDFRVPKEQLRRINRAFPVLWDEERPGHLETCEHACLYKHCITCGERVNLNVLSIYCENCR